MRLESAVVYFLLLGANLVDPIADNDGMSQFNDLQKILSAADRRRKFDDWMKDLRSAEAPAEEFEGSTPPEYSLRELSVNLPVSFELPFHVRIGNRLKTIFSEESLRRVQARRGDLYLLISVMLLAVALRSSIGPVGFSKITTLWHQEMINAGLAVPPQSANAAQPEARVWVDFSSDVYYCPGSRKYGKTRNGQFTTEGNARLSQYQPASHKACQ